jgi:hypothetical protein
MQGPWDEILQMSVAQVDPGTRPGASSLLESSPKREIQHNWPAMYKPSFASLVMHAFVPRSAGSN